MNYVSKRKIDELGRIVIPIEIRKDLSFGTKDEIDLFIDNSSLILKKSLPTCVFCGETKNLKVFLEKPICTDCIEKVTSLIGNI